MKHILSRGSRGLLAQFVRSNIVLGFDFDGTLAPITRDPARAFMRPSTRHLLAELTSVYPCVVISGRAQDDALRRLRGTGVHRVIGNHGIEPWHGMNPLLRRVQQWLPLLEERLRRLHGVSVENKLFSIAVHYRRARHKSQVRAAILRVLRSVAGARVIGGKDVLNLLPADAPNKGTALQQVREGLQCDTALYVGDDETDEDVFALDDPGRLLTVRVGSKASSQAHFCIRGQPEIDRLIRTLLSLREGRYCETPGHP
jgi:trehalose 6-phosphate phosphatase